MSAPTDSPFGSSEFKAILKSCDSVVQKYVVALQTENSKLHGRIAKLETQNMSADNRIKALESQLKTQQQDISYMTQEERDARAVELLQIAISRMNANKPVIEVSSDS